MFEAETVLYNLLPFWRQNYQQLARLKFSSQGFEENDFYFKIWIERDKTIMPLTKNIFSYLTEGKTKPLH